MRRIVITVIFLLSININLKAQNDILKSYENFRNEVIESYSDFNRSANEQYVEFLKQAWKTYHSEPAVKRPEEKRISPVKFFEGHKKNDNGKELTVSETIPIPKPIAHPVPLRDSSSENKQVEDFEHKQENTTQSSSVPVTDINIDEEKVCFDFFGDLIEIRADKSLRFSLLSTDREEISYVWKRLSGGAYDNIVYDCQTARLKYRLSDWAYLLMLLEFSDAFLPNNTDALLMASYLFCQSGYKMRLGISNSGLTFLFGTPFQIYGAPCYKLDGEDFYQINGRDEEMEIVDFSFPNEKPLSLLIEEEQIFGKKMAPLHCFESSSIDGLSKFEMNQNLIKFFSMYPASQLEDNPVTRWGIVANSPLDSSVKEYFYPYINNMISGKSITESVSIILDFIQSSFNYKTDEEVWGHERSFFAEETLYYQYNDCEDRAVLFSRIIRDLLGLKVVLMYYPGHLTTAVCVPDDIDGDYIQFESERYYLCDPTYIGATIGMTMPGFDNATATVILLK